MSDKEKTLADVADKTVDAITRAAEKFADMAPGAWDVAVRQQIVEGWVQIATPLVAFAPILLISYLVGRRAKGKSGWFEGFGEAPTLPGVCAIIFGFALFLSSFIIPIEVSKGAKKIINPEYYAAVDILWRIR